MAMIRCFWLSSSTGRRAGPLPLVKRRFQTALLVSMADFANRLRGERDDAGDLRRAGPLSQLQQRHGAQDDPNLLDAAAQQVSKLLLVLRSDRDAQVWTAHALSMHQNIST